MSQFKDREGREWVIDITFADYLRVQKDTGVNLRDLLNDEMRYYLELINNPEKFGAVLFSLCSVQAKARDVGFEDLARAMDGDSFEDCQNAFQEAFINFLPRRQREAMKTLTAKLEAAINQATTEAMERIEKTDLTSSPSGSGAPVSSESTPAPPG